MRLSERIQNGNTTNFLKSLNEGVKLDEARSHKEDNEKAAPRTEHPVVHTYNKEKEKKIGTMWRKSNGMTDEEIKKDLQDIDKQFVKRDKVNKDTYKKYGSAYKGGYDSATQKYNNILKDVDKETPQVQRIRKDLAHQVKINRQNEIANKKANESANLEERNLTRAERYNRNMERIWNNYNAQLNRMADYLKQNGFSDEEIEELRKNTGLGASALPDKAREIADKNGSDEWHKVVYGVNESALNEYDEGTNFEDWTRLVVEIKYVAEENGYDLSDKEAEKIADEMSSLGFFYEYELPDPDDYDNESWEDIRSEILNNIEEYKSVEESCNKKDTKTESAKTLTLRPTSSKLNEADSLELKEEYTISDLDNLVWSGARDRWIDYTDEQKEFLVDYFIESFGYIDGEIPTTTEFNDFIWFEADDILAENGMTGNTPEEETEEV